MFFPSRRGRLISYETAVFPCYVFFFSFRCRQRVLNGSFRRWPAGGQSASDESPQIADRPVAVVFGRAVAVQEHHHGRQLVDGPLHRHREVPSAIHRGRDYGAATTTVPAVARVTTVFARGRVCREFGVRGFELGASGAPCGNITNETSETQFKKLFWKI